MQSHAPENYICPICLGIEGIESEETLLMQADLVYKDNNVAAFINSFWSDGNDGHVIVVPVKHIENMYEMPPELGKQIFELTKKIAVAMKTTHSAEGITIRQNNEPAGDQHAFHYHMHVYPRYHKDSFNINMTKKSRLSNPEERIAYAEKLKAALK